MHEPGSRETALVERGAVVLVCDGAALRAETRATASPSTPTCRTTSRTRPPTRRRLPGGRLRRAATQLDPRREGPMRMPKTMFDKIWETHEVAHGLLYIDLHLVHEVTSPQAFDGLRLAGRPVRRPDRTLATADHNTPTDGTPVAARDQGRALARAGGNARAQLRRVRRARLLARIRPPGDRARDRPRARRHAAGHDDRLRRLAHLHARRLRRARVRDRHERGRARAGDAVHGPAQAALDADLATRASSASA